MIDVKRFRVEKNIKQKELCDILGIAQPYMSAIERGERPLGEDKLKILYKHFGDEILAYKLSDIVIEINDSNNSTITDCAEGVAHTGKLIPFFDADAAAGTEYGMSMESARLTGMIEIGSVLRDSESAIRVYGNSMTPNYPAGCVIGLRLNTDSFIEPGHVYVIETRDNRYLKRVYYSDDRVSFHCLSDNQMKYEDGPRKGKLYYQDFEIPINDVIRLHRVVGVIKRNIL